MITFVESSSRRRGSDEVRVTVYLNCTDLPERLQVEVERLGVEVLYLPELTDEYSAIIGSFSARSHGAALERSLNLERFLRAHYDSLVAGDAKAVLRMREAVESGVSGLP